MSMQIFIKTLVGDTIGLDVNPDETIRSVKEKIQREDRTPVSQQTLTLNGQRLDDAKTLKSYNIEDGAHIQLVFDKPLEKTDSSMCDCCILI